MKKQLSVIDSKTELDNCNFVKTVLMIIIVAYHSILYWNGSWFDGQPIFSSAVLPVIARWLNSFHIYTFALVSGYIFSFLRFETEKYNNFGKFVKNKAKRLLIPYAFIAAVWVIPVAVILLDYGVKDVLKSYVLGIAPSQLWFLLMLFGVFIIFYVLSDFFKKQSIFVGGVTVIAFWGVGTLGMILVPNVFQVFRAFVYVPFFWLGLKMRQCGSALLKKVPLLVWALADMLLFVVDEYSSKQSGTIFKVLNLGIGFVLNIVGAITAFLILQRLADVIKWKESKFVKLLSKHSMTVYLFHQQVIYVFIYFLNGKVNPYFNALINFLGAMVISLAISVLLNKFKVTRFLIGEK